jgi:hypothetical protein
MDIKKATSVQMVTPKYGFAVFETDYNGTPCKPTVHFLIKQTTKLGKTGEYAPWYQMTPGWYVETLLNDKPTVKNLGDEKEVGLYIDYGQDWFIPAGAYSMMWDWLEEYMNNPNARYSDYEVTSREVW